MAYKVLEGLYYAESDEWVKVEGDVATVGITDYAQDKLGDVVYVGEAELHKQVKKGDAVLTVESVKAASDIFAPVSGEIIDVNKDVISDPSLLNKDPYGAWLFKMKITNPEELKELMDAKGYEEYRKE